jgi:hypothetical protein
MREYKIAKTGLWYKIYRVRYNESWTMDMEWLKNNWYIHDIDWATIFYSINDATSALIISKAKWKKELTESVSKKETDSKKGEAKSYWWELS